MKQIFILVLFCPVYFMTSSIHGQELYFPPLSASQPWLETSPESLGWCVDQTDALYDFLEAGNSKGFIVLKDGKIVLEKYFGTFTVDSLWYWASAGKTITAFLVGKAQEEGLLSIEDATSQYLGEGWTSCTPGQELNIKIKNQLMMTTGLDDGTGDVYCTLPECLQYLAEPGTRWAYHNAPYTLLEDVIVAATGQGINIYTQQKLKSKTGMNGLWVTVDYNNVYYSNLRSMARFGLLAQNDFVWNDEVLLTDQAFVSQLTNTSQELNPSYGYLWWLNGKGSIMLPGSQIVFPVDLAPDAPADMFAALGKNGQIISVAKSSRITFVRIGNPPGDNGEVPVTWCNEIWQKLNAVMCEDVSVVEMTDEMDQVYPNPTSGILNVLNAVPGKSTIRIYTTTGNLILNQLYSSAIDVSHLSPGIYILESQSGESVSRSKFVIDK